MPQDSLKSVVYRSFVTCDDPRGVVKCKTTRKSKTEPLKAGDQIVSSSKKEERKEMVCKESGQELNSASSFQLLEVSKGAQKLNQVIDSLARGISFDRQSKDIAKDLLRGALDLQESLVMLGKLQEASQYVAKLNKRPKEKAEEGDFDGSGIGRTKSERIGDGRYEMEFEKPRFSVDGASRDCYQELREVIRESFARQNLLPPSYPVKRVSFETRELELFPDEKACFDRGKMDPLSTSSSQSSFEKACFDRRKMGFTANPLSTTSTQSSIPSLESTSLSKLKEEMPKAPNLIAKLMGLEEISSKPLQSTLQKDRLFNQRRPIFEIDLPKAKKPPSVLKKVDPKCKTLEEIIETMQLKGLLKSKFVDGPKHETRQHIVSELENPPIVIMRPFYAPDFHGEMFYTSPCFGSASDTREKVRKSRREDFLPETTNWQKVASNTTLYRNMRAENGQTRKSSHEKGAKEQGGKPANPNENGMRVHAKLSSIKTKASGPGQKKKEVVEKNPDKVQKAAPNLRKAQGLKNAKVKDAAKKMASAKLRKADTVAHISEKEVTRQKKSTSDLVSNRAASRNSRNRKNMKADKPVENKGGKDVQIDLISKKETHKTDNKVEASEKLCFQETSEVFENHISDHISDESLPCDSSMPTVMCDINIESMEHENSCLSLVLNENRNSGASSATRSLLLSSASFLHRAEELFDTDSWQPAVSLEPACLQNGMAETKLLLDCAYELLNNKKQQCVLLSSDPLSKKLIRSKLSVSLDKLVAEICEGIESLRSYKDVAATLTRDTLYSLTIKDLWCKGVMNGAWDLGWSKGFTSDEMEEMVVDIEKHLLCGIIEDALAGFALS